MNYLIDTNILLWLRVDYKKLKSSIIELLNDSHNIIYYSVITPWEISIKQSKGKLNLPDDFFSTFSKLGFLSLPVEDWHVDILRELPDHHNDPFDRMLVAQAKAENLTFITTDKALAAYPIKTLLVSV